jgi:hypothetical protein
VQKLVNKLSQQRDITVDYRIIEAANHFFTNKLDALNENIADYLQTNVPEFTDTAADPAD